MGRFGARIFAFTCLIGTLGLAQDSVPGRLLVGHRAGADVAADRAAVRIEAAGGRWSGYQRGINVSVLEVEPSRQKNLWKALEQSGRFAFVEPDYLARGLATPNDPDYSQQWHLPIIQAPFAWNMATGKLSVTVAMIDSGVDPTHPDLAANLAPGWSFLTGTTDTHDVLGHGTQTAGTAAAIGNNGVGVTGVAWNVSIMPLVVLNSSNFASYSNIASAIQYAADHGARIANISIGGTSASSTLQSAVNYAWSKGTVVIAAAGNYGTSSPVYPAACTSVVAVTATDGTDTVTSWSSFGTWVSLAAPGSNIMTTTMGGGYGLASGTSFSAPVVSGVAALLLSASASLTAQSLVSTLEQNADDLGAPGFDQYYGYGRVNAYRAVGALGIVSIASTPPSVSISAPAPGAIVQGQVQVAGTASSGASITKVELYADSSLVAAQTSSSFSFGWNSQSVANGGHTLTVKAYDAVGNIGQSSASVSVSNPILPPQVTIGSPANGATVWGNFQIIASASSTSGVSRMALYVNGVQYASCSTGYCTTSVNARKLASSDTITATAWDPSGNAGSSSVSVTVAH